MIALRDERQSGKIECSARGWLQICDEVAEERLGYRLLRRFGLRVYPIVPRESRGRVTTGDWRR